MQITTVSGPSFFLRTVYLSLVGEDELAPDAEFTDEKEEELIDAGLCFACEQKALDYLNRSEQYRLGLTSKLVAKGFDKIHIEKALDYLESKKYLDDSRFARVWLRNRMISHAEGRSKLAGELASRGIARDIASQALDEFFEENSEEKLCLRAYSKCKKTKKDEEKITLYLLKNGFAIQLIKKVKELYGTEK
ncbi:regulatory protein RecX [Treponema sp.]|uniref:regulatory protein RecX n=1 Tax=Treponema sp. TaxID=166 RepID=UPI00298D9696|nr:regulatory protein RecX [Treponema sp.]MCR5612828.1 recombination regulator RecX [Treponema sp.]